MQSLKAKAKCICYELDPLVAKINTWRGRENGTLRAICLHAVKKGESSSNGMPPGAETSLEQLKIFIEILLSNGYTFITPSDISNGLIHQKKYIMITFDDGYYSTIYAVQLFKEYGLKLTVLISPYYLYNQVSYWSDVFYREVERHTSTSTNAFSKKFLELRYMSQVEREDFLIKNFGKCSLKSWNDGDRPLSINELKELYAFGNVEIGNHTMTHTALCGLSEKQVRREIVDAQETICKELGVQAQSIAYPYGYFDETSRQVCEKLGFKYGLTTENKIHSIKSLKVDSFMHIGRFGNWARRNTLEQYLLKIQTGFLMSEKVIQFKRSLLNQ